MSSPYDDIIHLPHHVSTTHPPMSMADRAAQFSPFAALSGHDAAIREAARLTEQRPITDESVKWEISDRLQYAAAHPGTILHITYFIPDTHKSGGTFAEISGELRKLCARTQRLTLQGGAVIPIDDIIDAQLSEQ